MKPSTHTASLRFSVGAPWEIYRTQSGITTGRVIDLYTKSGSVGQYNSLIALIPDYGVVLTVLTAGPDNGAIETVPDVVLQAVLPVLEEMSKTDECLRLCGTFEETSQSSSKSSVIIIARDQEPGLVITKWTSNGVDVLAAASDYALSTGSGAVIAVRLYSTNLSSPSDVEGNLTVASYRAVFETEDASTRPMIFNARYGTWASVDQLMYGGVAVDDFNFLLDGDGIATAVEPHVLRATYSKRSE